MIEWYKTYTISYAVSGVVYSVIEPRLHFFTSAKLSSQMSVLIPHPLFKSNKFGKSCKNCHEIGSDLRSFIFTQGISRKLFQDFH